MEYKCSICNGTGYIPVKEDVKLPSTPYRGEFPVLTLPYRSFFVSWNLYFVGWAETPF